jgi:hypothetical protein
MELCRSVGGFYHAIPASARQFILFHSIIAFRPSLQVEFGLVEGSSALQAKPCTFEIAF